MFPHRRFVVTIISIGILGLYSPLWAQETPTAPPASLPTGAPLSLDQAIAFSFANHGDVLGAREQFQAANERITTAKSNRAPQLSATVGTDYQNGRVVSSLGGTTVSTPVVTSTLTTGIALSQNIFDSGRTKYSVRQSRGQAGSALSNVGSARNSLAYEVSTRFFDQLRAEQLVAQREKQVEVTKGQQALTEAQIAAGTSPRSDIYEARVTVSQAQFDLVSAQNQLRVASANLRGTLGLGPGEKISLQNEKGQGDANTPNTDAPETSSLENELALALSRRPDVVDAQIAIFSNQAALKSAQIEARPNVSASLGYNLDPRETNDRRLNVGATLSLPLFNGGGRRSNARAAQDELDAAKIRLAQAQRDAQTEVQAAWTQISGQQERVTNARALLDSAQNAYETAQARYSEGNGIGIALDVSVAQSRLFEAQVTLISAQFDLRLARIDLRRATGDFAWENGRVPAALQAMTTQK